MACAHTCGTRVTINPPDNTVLLLKSATSLCATIFNVIMPSNYQWEPVCLELDVISSHPCYRSVMGHECPEPHIYCFHTHYKSTTSIVSRTT